MASLKLPSVSWAAAVWSVPAATCACFTAISFIAHAQGRWADPKITFISLYALVIGVSLLLWFWARTPMARGVALGIIGVPFMLAWTDWLIG